MNNCTYDSIINMILYHVSASPDRVAVKCGAQRLTYRQLNEQSDRVAAYLEQKGAVSHGIIAVAMERTVQLVSVCLGIMKHGSAYLPIDIEYPEERIQSLLNNAKIEHIFCDAPVSIPQQFSEGIINPQDIINSCYQRKSSNLPNKETPAYCIYTSGSTGEPKGVLISHDGLLNHTQWFIDEFGVTEADVLLQRTSIAFDASVWELWTGLAAGACTVILPTAYAKHPLGILLTLQQEHISIAQFVPTLLRELVRLRQFEHMPCRLVFCGGESLTWELVDQFFSKTRSQLVNLYGPTETTIDVTFWRVEQGGGRDLPPPIGKPIRGMQVYLLDEHGAPVKQEQEGEIAIAGPGVAIGYVNTPSENALRFSTLNVDGKPVRIYKTGDIGIVSASGELSFLGRRDSQHKVNGHRVELLAIEQVVQQTPGVHCAAVYLDILASGEKQICACYVVEANVETHLLEQRIKQAVSAQLPAYMHPSQLYSLANLPLLPNGKVNHNALREMNANPSVITPSVAGDASTLDRLQAIWKEILSHQAISADSHFFECGATSLSVMMLLGRIANLFNVDLTPKDIFDHPILAQQAELLNGSARQCGENSLLLDAHAWRKRESEDTPGLAQREILEKPPETPAYLENVVMAFYIRGECSVARVREAFGAVLEQQPALRCSFEFNSHGQWRRLQHAFDEFPLPFHLINLALDSNISRTVADLIVEESSTAFDLRHPLLIRATYLECQGTDDVLIITAHHIAFDGWSGAILVDQLCAHYQSLLATGVPDEAKYCLQYADYTDAQHQRLAENLLDKHSVFWQETLKQLPEPFPLRGAIQRPQQFTYRSAVLPLNLDAQYPAIAQLCSRTGFSLYTVILTAFLVSLARNTGMTDLYVRSPVANRTDAALEPVVGYFVHPMVIRPRLSDWSPSLRLLEQVNHCVLDAYGHAMLPPHIFEANCSPRDVAYGSRFPYWYNHHNYPSRQRQLGTSQLHGIGVPSSGIKTDVSLNTLRTESGLVGSLSYYRDAIPDDCVEALLVSFKQALNELLAIGK
ncbi:amino acid adenylation domain-containing protein [Pseudomonas sp. PLMAX]|uniref:non-ribosomal peptide synthetase n=1 Tax=Pseudomonas sp. PLMAX TaxID=2201998 RepID=UPI0038BCB0B0